MRVPTMSETGFRTHIKHMYTIKQKDKEALRELSDIIRILNIETTLDKRAFKKARSLTRKAQYLASLVLDHWEEEHTYA